MDGLDRPSGRGSALFRQEGQEKRDYSQWNTRTAFYGLFVLDNEELLIFLCLEKSEGTSIYLGKILTCHAAMYI